MTPMHYLLVGLVLAFVPALIICGVMGRRWRLRHGKPPALTGFHPELYTVGASVSHPVRKEAARVARKGRQAAETETAHVACLLARQTIRHTENPWYRAVLPLLFLFQVPNLVNVSVQAETALMTTAFAVGAVALTAGTVLEPVTKTRALTHARTALELNQELADAYAPAGAPRGGEGP